MFVILHCEHCPFVIFIFNWENQLFNCANAFTHVVNFALTRILIVFIDPSCVFSSNWSHDSHVFMCISMYIICV